jgi:hypothetical protein
MSNTVAAGTVASRSSMSARPCIRGCYSPAGENDNCRETRRAAHSQDLRLTGGYSNSGWESIRGIDKVLHTQHNMAMGGHELCLRFLRCSQRMACLQQLHSPRGKGSCWNEKGSTPFTANCPSPAEERTTLKSLGKKEKPGCPGLSELAFVAPRQS